MIMEGRIKEINNEIMKTQLIYSPGVIMLGLSFYGLWGAKGDAFHPLLNNPSFNYSLLAIGAFIANFEAIKLSKLAKEIKILKSKNT